MGHVVMSLVLLFAGTAAAQDAKPETAHEQEAKPSSNDRSSQQPASSAGSSQNAKPSQDSKASPPGKPTKDSKASTDSAQDQSQQTPKQASDDSDQKEPIQKADDLKNKLTFATYFSAGDKIYDLNMRHQFGHLVTWIAGYYDPQGIKQGRVGAEYDFQNNWLLFIPTFEVGTNGAVAGQLYAELGAKNYAIVGYSETNLKDFFDLFFDPSESVQLGAGRKLSDYDRIYGYVIFDVRLHTHQQDTHILWRRKLNSKNGITFDALYKSGYTDEGKYIRAGGFGVYYDRPHWFWKLYYDQNVNFTRFTMVRAGIGLKF
ncbi:MAG: hypothetical protein ACREAC_03140 [Blastocatellia bacterium]